MNFQNREKASEVRRLAALVFTDMVGYSALAFEDEQRANALVAEIRTIVRDALVMFNGREHQTTGDGFFLEFASAIDAVRCAIAVQATLNDRYRHVPQNMRLKIRIGVHVGDILANDQDLYGNNVNLAARIEPLAPAGGICITRQVYDQVVGRVDGIRLRKVGQRHLKNIKGGAEIFKVELPWEIRSRSRFRFVQNFVYSSLSTWTMGLVMATLGVLFASLLWAAYKGVKSVSDSPTVGGRLAATFPDEPRGTARVDLRKNWSYFVPADAKMDLGSLPGENSGAWLEYDHRQPWIYADRIQGVYWLKRTFTVADKFVEPAIILGLIGDHHRVYLNGHFIGGSERYVNVVDYPFDKEFLTQSGPNTLLVRAITRPTGDPGILIPADTGAFLGEFADVRHTSFRELFHFIVLDSIYLVVCILIFAACFAYSCLYRSSNKFFYCSLILLLGAIQLAHYNTWLWAVTDFTIQRYFKAVGLCLTPFVLLSGLLHVKRNFRAEFYSNTVTLMALLGMTYGLLVWPGSLTQYVAFYNFTLIAAAIYTLTWLCAVILRGGWRSHPFSFEAVFQVFGFVSLSTFIVSIKLDFIHRLIPKAIVIVMWDLGKTAPFFFAIYMIIVATIDYVRTSRVSEMKRLRDELILKQVHLMRAATDPFQIITDIQDQTCEFLHASRSTLYVFEENNGRPMLKATYAIGQNEGGFEVKPALRIDQGVVGYALQTRTPLLLEDIKSDPRFFGAQARHAVEGHASYKSGSCMIFPLTLGARHIGVLTLADKRDGEPFSNSDFELGLEISASLAFLLDNQQMQLVRNRVAS